MKSHTSHSVTARLRPPMPMKSKTFGKVHIGITILATFLLIYVSVYLLRLKRRNKLNNQKYCTIDNTNMLIEIISSLNKSFWATFDFSWHHMTSHERHTRGLICVPKHKTMWLHWACKCSTCVYIYNYVTFLADVLLCTLGGQHYMNLLATFSFTPSIFSAYFFLTLCQETHSLGVDLNTQWLWSMHGPWLPQWLAGLLLDS